MPIDANIPLSGVAPANPLDMATKAMGFRSMMLQQQSQQQEQQLRQIQIDDAQKLTKAYHDSGGDLDKLMQLAPQYGVSSHGIMSLQSEIMGLREAHAKLDKATLENQATVNQKIRGQGEAILQAAPEDRAALWKLNRASGLQDPHTASIWQDMPEEYPGDQAVQERMNGLATAEQLTEYGLKKQQTREASNKADVAATQAGLNQNKLDIIEAAKSNPNQFHSAVDQISQPGTPLNQRMHSQVQFYLAQGNVDAAQKVLTQGASEMGAIEKETNPQVINARVGQAIATEVGKAKALAPDIKDITRTTGSGIQYINAEDVPGDQGKFIRQQASKAGIPVVDKDVHSTLTDIDTARENMKYMLNTVSNKLASGAASRLYTAPENTIERLAQTDPELAAIGTYRNAAIQTMRAVAGSKGLRINQSEINMAIDNDIPKPTDTLPVAQQRLKNLNTFLSNAEKAHLTLNRQTGSSQPDFFSQFGGKKH